MTDYKKVAETLQMYGTHKKEHLQAARLCELAAKLPPGEAERVLAAREGGALVAREELEALQEKYNRASDARHEAEMEPIERDEAQVEAHFTRDTTRRLLRYSHMLANKTNGEVDRLSKVMQRVYLAGLNKELP